MLVRTIAIVAGVFCTLAIGVGTAQAQATRTWISGVGDDANPCSRTAPCKTFAGAISKTAAGGEIDCLDPGGFGAVTVTKSITLDCASGSGGQVGSILNSGTNGITVNDGGAGTIIVIVRNLSINGISHSTGPGVSGISVFSAASLTVDHVNIFDQGGTSGSQAGIYFAPSTVAKLFVHESNIADGLADGIIVKGSVATTVSIDRTTVTNNGANGIRIYDGGTATITNSLSSHNVSKGVFADAASGGVVTLYLDHDTVSLNGGQGVTALATTGGTATVTLSDDTITNNTSVGVQATGAGTTSIKSLSNNNVSGNGGSNATATAVTPY
jgi:parallel beta helix pectate lyase-like protein